MRRALFLALLLLSACASAPDPRFRDPTLAEWRAADFGEEPANYDATIRTYLEDVLPDPRGATLTIKDGPKKTWIGFAPDFRYGYGVCMEIAERGVYSENANFGPTFFLLLNDKVVSMSEGSEGERLCSRLGRNPENS
jgi:hypothetical protein